MFCAPDTGVKSSSSSIPISPQWWLFLSPNVARLLPNWRLILWTCSISLWIIPFRSRSSIEVVSAWSCSIPRISNSGNQVLVISFNIVVRIDSNLVAYCSRSCGRIGSSVNLLRFGNDLFRVTFIDRLKFELLPPLVSRYIAMCDIYLWIICSFDVFGVWLFIAARKVKEVIENFIFESGTLQIL
jgi:hypothetical protein